MSNDVYICNVKIIVGAYSLLHGKRYVQSGMTFALR